jgi:hypothetical protein
LTWNWNSQSWKTSNKLLLLFATIWPVIYMAIFFGIVVTTVVLSERARDRNLNTCARIDVLQLDRKIRAGEIKQLTVRQFDVISSDRAGNCKYQTWIREDSTRKELLAEANEVADGHPRVDLITYEKERPLPLPIALGTGVGFIALMVVHFATIIVMMAVLPFYIVLAVKNEQMDQNMRIVWIVLFCMIGFLANPVYWYLHVWRKPKRRDDPGNAISATVLTSGL